MGALNGCFRYLILYAYPQGLEKFSTPPRKLDSELESIKLVPCSSGTNII